MQRRTFDILAARFHDLVAWMETCCGKGVYHAAAVYRQVFRQGRLAPEELEQFASSGQLAARVKKTVGFRLPELADRVSEQGVTKLVFRLADGVQIESVVIPMANHFTLCVSTQAGCRMGCRFCRTGQMGFVRNLTAGEIVGQVLAARIRLGFDVRNLVFMGMGEPLDNFDHFVKAVQVLEDQRGLDIAKRRMTVSTAGLVDAIYALAGRRWSQLKLAVSLNAPDDRLRSYLMPVNRRWPLAELIRAMQAYPLPVKGHILVEYVLIHGVNDSLGYADRLAGLLQGLPVKVNLIACNPGAEAGFAPPPDQVMESFRRRLVAHKIFVRVRSSKGCGILAACGQLGRPMVFKEAL